jgi:hypothetical protein
MANGSNYAVVYPGNKRISLDGGLNNKFPRANILDNESPDCLNVVFSGGAVETRGGSTTLNTTTVGTFSIDGLYTRNDSAGSRTMLVFAGTHMFYLAGTSTFTTVPSAQSVFTAGVRVCAVEYQDYLFIGNGGVTPYKYDGAVFSRHGVPAPSSFPVLSSNATGSLTGDYRYKVTYVNSASVEGDVNTASATFTAASATIRLTSVPVAPASHGVSSRRIYRTEAGGATYKRVGSIADNSTTTFDDNIADASLGVAAPTDNGEPPKYSVAAYHADRLFVNDIANPSLVWYSEIAEPFTFKTTNFIRAGDATGDIVRALSVYNNSVLVFCDNSIWLIYMPSADDTEWSVIRIKGQYGCKSPFAPVLYQNKVLFPAVQNNKFVGFAVVSGDSVAPSATLLTAGTAGSDMISDRIEPDMFLLNESYLQNISGFIFKQKAWMSVPYGVSQLTNNRIYVMDFSISNLNKSQDVTWVPNTGMQAAQFTEYNGKLYFGSANAVGKVIQADTTTYNDDGLAINSYAWTKELTGHDVHSGKFKDFRVFRMLLEKAGDWLMNLHYRVDSDKDDEGMAVSIDLNPGGTLWGSFSWGGTTWGGGTDQEEKKISLGATKGNRIQFKFSNQNVADQYFKVHNFDFQYNVRGER